MKWCTGPFWIGVVLAGLAVAAAALADVTITMESETKSPSGKKTETVTQYYTPTKMRHELGETSMMIMDLDEQRVITIMPTAKKYFVQTFEQLKARMARMKVPEREVEIEETDKEAEIAGYTCHKVIVRTTTGTSKSVTEAWVAKDVKGIADVHAFHKAMVEAYKDVPQHWANMVAPKQFAEKGLFPLKTVTKQAGMTVTMTVTKIEEGDLDEALFEIPEGYEDMQIGGDIRSPRPVQIRLVGHGVGDVCFAASALGGATYDATQRDGGRQSDEVAH